MEKRDLTPWNHVMHNLTSFKDEHELQPQTNNTNYVYIHYMNLENTWNDENELNQALELVPLVYRNQILHQRNKCVRKTSLASYLLKRYILTKHYKKTVEDIRYFLTTNKNGRPIVNDGGLDFNISHQSSWIAIGVRYDSNPIGIDLVDTKSDIGDLEAYKGLSGYKEYESIIQSTNTKDTFLKGWAVKEAFVKANGLSLSDIENDPNIFEVVIDRGLFLSHGKEIKDWTFSLKRLSNEILLAIATPKTDIKSIITELTYAELLSAIK